MSECWVSEEDLADIIRPEYEGANLEAKLKLKVGEFVTGTLIATETRRQTRATAAAADNEDGSDNIIEKQIENARTTVSKSVVKLTEEINRRI